MRTGVVTPWSPPLRVHWAPGAPERLQGHQGDACVFHERRPGAPNATASQEAMHPLAEPSRGLWGCYPSLVPAQPQASTCQPTQYAPRGPQRPQRQHQDP